MDENFTLLFLSQHYPISQQLQIIPYEDMSIDADVAGYLHATEQQASQQVLDYIFSYASAAVQHR